MTRASFIQVDALQVLAHARQHEQRYERLHCNTRVRPTSLKPTDSKLHETHLRVQKR